MQVLGKAKIFKNEYNGKTYYSTSISKKKEDGTYENMYLTVQFRKGQETDGDIDITNGFHSFYTDKNGVPKIKIVVLEYTAIEKNTIPENTEADFMDDLPF